MSDLESNIADYALEAEIKVALQAIFESNNPEIAMVDSDLDKLVSIIQEKCLTKRDIDWNYDGYDFIEHWIKDNCNHILADKTPMESRDEILVLFECTMSKEERS